MRQDLFDHPRLLDCCHQPRREEPCHCRAWGAPYDALPTARAAPQYAEDRLAARADTLRLRDSHADYFCRWAEEWAEKSWSDELAWRLALEGEFGNLRPSIAWAIDSADEDRALRTIAAIERAQGPFLLLEIADWAKRAVELPAAADHRLGPHVCGVGALATEIYRGLCASPWSSAPATQDLSAMFFGDENERPSDSDAPRPALATLVDAVIEALGTILSEPRSSASASSARSIGSVASRAFPALRGRWLRPRPAAGDRLERGPERIARMSWDFA